MPDLSILIPARNEMFLARTIEDILENMEADTNILVGCDGKWADPRIKDHPRVVILHYSESIGQRAITNKLCTLTDAKYIMKVDAHCAFDKGFDRKMIEFMERVGGDVTAVPIMRNLYAFDWVCEDGHRRYQSPSGVCKKCGKETTRDIKWIGKTNPQSTAYCFNTEPKFKYFGQYKKRDEYKDSLKKNGYTETMSLQGSCFMMTRDKYWDLNICDEELGSWGSQGIEVACKTWLSGGRVLVNHDTWYAHMFRTQGGDFGFPYKLSGNQVVRAKKKARDLFFKETWQGQIKPLSWLIDKFYPIPEWTDEDVRKIKREPSKGILYYTDNRLNMKLAHQCRKYMSKSGLPITSVSLKPMNFGNNIHFDADPGYLTMFRQILAGLKAMPQNIVYFCEHDVFYHSNHFQFTPEDEYKWYYNGNYWFIRSTDGFAVHYDVSPLSGLVVYRDTAIKHFEERVKMIEEEGFSYHMGFEPFTHGRVKWKFWCDYEVFTPENPNVDIAHGDNVTLKRWDQSRFRRKPKFWEESDENHIPGWDNMGKIMNYVRS